MKFKLYIWFICILLCWKLYGNNEDERWNFGEYVVNVVNIGEKHVVNIVFGLVQPFFLLVWLFCNLFNCCLYMYICAYVHNVHN